MGSWRRQVTVLALAACAAACDAKRRTGAEHEDAAAVSAQLPALPQERVDSVPSVAAAPLSAAQSEGRDLYNAYCWTCHGLFGHGDGPAARGFRETLPDLGSATARLSIDQLARRMRQGRAGTASAAAEPVWHALTTEELRKAIDYVTSFAPRGARGNPAAGRLLYATYCVHCHGQRGAGDGRLTATLPRRPPDLRTVDAAGRAGQLFESIRDGGSPEHARYMPNWGRVFSDQQLWDLVAYLPALRADR